MDYYELKRVMYEVSVLTLELGSLFCSLLFSLLAERKDF